jgi:hypothetical protein
MITRVQPFTVSDLGHTYSEVGQRYLLSLLATYHKAEPALPTDTVAHTRTLTGLLHLVCPGDAEAFAEADVL